MATSLNEAHKLSSDELTVSTPRLRPNTTESSQDHQTSESDARLIKLKAASTSSSTSTVDLCDPEPTEPFSLTKWLLRRGQYKAIDLDSIATKRSVYDDPKLAKFYWPKPEYENLHRFDVDARWTHREEKALVRKIDWRVMLWTAISFSALNLDRNNLTQANTDNFLPDLGMTTDGAISTSSFIIPRLTPLITLFNWLDYNLGNTVFKIAFLCAELPSQLVSKKLGPDVWIPIQIIVWSIITIYFLKAALFPDLILYLSYFYTKFELPFRLALFWVSLEVASIISSFLAFGVLRLRGLHGLAGWRYLFLVEGAITLAIGIATFFYDAAFAYAD
ncbi:hypothetical protein NP233_g10728 [Leucocoprinus birnbaumii]|uniref:Uncharacterized protein n=1 Tax=Leucocoprinus birnbaumii TaxID=56174 RepID=A0AAD5VNR9_9AGAR|nr:hypothetical protein NP233_g10728 [Leucocoprinus birnbaumii]